MMTLLGVAVPSALLVVAAHSIEPSRALLVVPANAAVRR
jgi:hypothetical protein